MLKRLSIFIYWAMGVISILFVLFSIHLLFDDGLSVAWIALCIALVLYFLGFGIRYVFTGLVTHPLLISIKKIKRKK